MKQPTQERPLGEMLTNREAAEICKLSIGTLNNYRTSKRFKDECLLENIHWFKFGARSIRWHRDVLEHWVLHRANLGEHRKWITERARSRQ
jgi:hypothetical protein